MEKRISSVGTLNNTIIDTTSTLLIGDLDTFAPLVHSVLVQREKAIFLEDEFHINNYSLMFRPLQMPVATEEVRMNRINESPIIHVENVHVLRVLGAGLIHFGSSRLMQAESRVKAIRHLLREPPQQR